MRDGFEYSPEWFGAWLNLWFEAWLNGCELEWDAWNAGGEL